MFSSNQSNYHKTLKNYARKLRNNSTLGEVILWQKVLSNRKMLGFQFLRQYPIDRYIADFICRKVHLIIEVDGSSHNNKYDEDCLRDKRLKELGYTTIRFEEKKIYTHLDEVIQGIERAIEDIISQSQNQPANYKPKA